MTFTSKELGQMLALKRKTTTKPCVVCGKVMPDVLTTKTTCSGKCRVKQFRAKKKAATSMGDE